MTQGKMWLAKYSEVRNFIESNHRNPSKHDEERDKYLNWIMHNRKQLNASTLKAERVEPFNQLLRLGEKYKHVNQYK